VQVDEHTTPLSDEEWLKRQKIVRQKRLHRRQPEISEQGAKRRVNEFGAGKRPLIGTKDEVRLILDDLYETPVVLRDFEGHHKRNKKAHQLKICTEYLSKLECLLSQVKQVPSMSQSGGQARAIKYCKALSMAASRAHWSLENNGNVSEISRSIERVMKCDYLDFGLSKPLPYSTIRTWVTKQKKGK